jgi:hypothetical protein
LPPLAATAPLAAKMMSFSGNKGAIWAAWLLSTCGFAILLAGVASMQNVRRWYLHQAACMHATRLLTAG